MSKDATCLLQELPFFWSFIPQMCWLYINIQADAESFVDRKDWYSNAMQQRENSVLEIRWSPAGEKMEVHTWGDP